MHTNKREHNQSREIESSTSNLTSRRRPERAQNRDLNSYIRHLQETAGNQAVQRTLQAQTGSAETDSESNRSIAFTGRADGASAPAQIKQGENDRARHEGEGNLPDRIRTKMEWAFGSEFSDVKVHRNSTTAERLDAIAYTQDEEIHFAPGYHPYTLQGQEHLGHELAHVVQQQRGDVKTTHRELGYNINSDSRLEREADAAASKVVSGQKVGSVRNGDKTHEHTTSPLQLQRQPIPSRSLILDVNTTADTVLNELIATAHAAGAGAQAETVDWRRIFHPVLESQIRGRTLGSISHKFVDEEGFDMEWEVSISFYIDNVTSTGRREEREVTTTQGGAASPSLGSSLTRTQEGGMTVGGEFGVGGGKASGEVSLGGSASQGQSQGAGGGLSAGMSQSPVETIA